MCVFQSGFRVSILVLSRLLLWKHYCAFLHLSSQSQSEKQWSEQRTVSIVLYVLLRNLVVTVQLCTGRTSVYS